LKNDVRDDARRGPLDAPRGGPLLDAAGLVADGSDFDLLSLSSSLASDEERAIADELAVVARIAQAHRKLHQVLPPPDPGTEHAPFASSWGHLDLIDVVGRGSYGTVYRAWDPRLDRLVALKLFHGARNPETVMREGRMLARIRHENVVTVYGADVYNGIAGIWMEYVHGQRLDQIVEQQGPLSAEDATLVGLAVCRALVAVHGAGLLHCDVKAQNVIREPGGRIVLMDLGAGRSTIPDDDSTFKLQVAGTPRYMAPEVFDKGSALPQSDVYSVGVLLFYLVSGKFPVDGKTLSEIRRAHLEGGRMQLRDVRQDLPEPFLRDVTRALDPSPMARHATPGELEAGLRGVPIAAEDAPAAVSRRGLRWIAAVATVVAALVAAVGWRFTSDTGTFTPDAAQSIAVLPIRNLTGDPSKAYLADGLTEVLISKLARVKSLRVPSYAAVAGFRDTNEASGTVAKRLGADLLLAGSILEAGNRSRIIVDLIDPKTDSVIWSEERTPDSSMLFAAQAELAGLIASHLRLRLSVDEENALKQRPLDARAQEAYLRGVVTAGTEILDLPTSLLTRRHFREAITIAPDFADAWAELAHVELRVIERASGVDRRQAASLVRELAERAVQLDSSSARGYEALGTVQFYHDWDFSGAERTFVAALQARPSSASIRQILSMLLATQNHLPEAIRLAEEGRHLEPLVAVRTTSVGILYYYARDYARAELEMRRALQIAPDFLIAHFGLGRVYSAMGRHSDALTELNAALGTSRPPAYLVEIARVLIAAGQRAESDNVLRALEERRAKGEGYSFDNHAYIAAAAGRIDEAFDILNRAIDERLTNVLWIDVDPRVDPLRSDPRFAALLARIGLRP
jgi:serine/threonine protein kinase/tetratricopeptide (TPR) repeat protein